MVVGVSRVEIFLPENHSLKERRQAVRRIIEKTRTRYNVSMIEIAETNLWQKAVIAFSVTGIRRDHVSKTIENVFDFIESLYIGEVINTTTEIIVIGNAV